MRRSIIPSSGVFSKNHAAQGLSTKLLGQEYIKEVRNLTSGSGTRLSLNTSPTRFDSYNIISRRRRAIRSRHTIHSTVSWMLIGTSTSETTPSYPKHTLPSLFDRAVNITPIKTYKADLFFLVASSPINTTPLHSFCGTSSYNNNNNPSQLSKYHSISPLHLFCGHILIIFTSHLITRAYPTYPILRSNKHHHSSPSNHLQYLLHSIYLSSVL